MLHFFNHLLNFGNVESLSETGNARYLSKKFMSITVKNIVPQIIYLENKCN